MEDCEADSEESEGGEEDDGIEVVGKEAKKKAPVQKV